MDCKKCPPNAVCYGEDKLAPEDGYFRRNETST